MVKCEICGKEFKALTNTHLWFCAGITVEEYKLRYPGYPTCSDELRMKLVETNTGKNLGKSRPDAKARMETNNPMKNPETAKKVGDIRKAQIVSGEYDAMKNFNHLPTPHEKQLQEWFEEWKLPLIYVGDGKKLIEGFCPDFICEERKIIVELELNFTHRPRNTEMEKEKAYSKAGYKTVWLTSMEPEYIRPWVSSFFQNPLKSVKIKKIWKEEGKTRKVYNMEVEPNNTYVANGIVVHNCYANAFRASLYTAFFDNSKTMGYRHCNAKYYKTEIDKMLKYRQLSMEEKQKLTGINKAFSLDIPVRLGIRFEDFLADEHQEGVALELLQYLADIGYPVMINTKSNVPGTDPYVDALSRNPARTAIHVTLITSDNKILKKIEPGAPSYTERLKAMKTLTQAGVRVVARIEPYLFLLTDSPSAVEKYQGDMLEAGVRHITFDTYSYTALNPGIRQSIQNAGYDFDRMFLAGADSQPLGSILLGSFMELFRKAGFSCSTFDMGNAPTNNQTICCEVGDWFKGGFNYGSTVVAARYIQSRGTLPTHWKNFVAYVDSKGGFLSEELKRDVHELWNIGGNLAYSHKWATHMVPTGMDEDGLIWRYDSHTPDYREILEAELL